jgi:predicted DNA-binding protein
MVVRLKPETESRVKDLSAKTGRAPEDIVEEAMSAYLTELAETREMLDARYNGIKTGKVTPVEGETVFERIRRKSEARRRQ